MMKFNRSPITSAHDGCDNSQVKYSGCFHDNRVPKNEAKKKNVEFPLTRPNLFNGPDPTDFIGKFVYTELKGQYKTVKPCTEWEPGNAKMLVIEQF